MSTVKAGLALSLLVETMQIFSFRTVDVNDLITNTLGTALGYGIARLATGGFHTLVFTGVRKTEQYRILAVSLGAMLICQPFVSGPLWRLLPW